MLVQEDVQIVTHDLDIIDYQACYDRMRHYTVTRAKDAANQIWLVQHQPVYTLGQAGKLEHLLVQSDIPVIHTDRGGQITYHDLGQLIYYVLIDLTQLKLNVRQCVNIIEDSIIEYLAHCNINAHKHQTAPGVYVAGKKIASIGLRVRHGYTYHGFSFNYATNKNNFANINVCGYPGLEVINFIDLIPTNAISKESVKQQLCNILIEKLYEQIKN